MIMLPPPLRAICFKTISTVLFIFLTFFTFGNSYADKTYKVQKNDFLGKIVKRNYSTDSNLSKEQVMVAILRANPEAFRGGNIHFLKRVDSLTLPSVGTVALIGQAEALQIVNKHYTFFKRNKTGNFLPVALKRPAKDGDKANDNSDTKNKIEIGTTKSDTSIENTTSPQVATEAEAEKTTTKTDDGLSTLSELTTDNTAKIDTTTTSPKNTTESESLSTLGELTENASEPKTEEPTTETTQDNKNPTSEGFSSLSELNESTPEPTSKGEDASADSLSTLSELTENTPDTSESSSLVDSLSTLNELEDEAAKTDGGTNVNQKLEEQQQATALKNNQIQELEKRKEEQSTTLDQLDNKIKTLEENLTKTPEDQAKETATKASSNAFVLDETTKPLLLLLPLLALLGLLWWWKRIKTAAVKTTAETTNVSVSDLRQNKEKKIFTKTDSYNAKSIERASKVQQAPADNKKDQPVARKAEVGQDKDEDKTLEVTEINENGNEEECAIKLDMARAYQDMGYPEEAKEMLEEIMREGTSQQQEMAESLLAVL